MKKVLLVLTGVVALTLAGAGSLAAKEKEVTIKGEAKCAKCTLHEADSCKTVIDTESKGKTQRYYVAGNDLAKDFHSEVCKGPKKVKAKGTVAKVDGKEQITLTKIDTLK